MASYCSDFSSGSGGAGGENRLSDPCYVSSQMYASTCGGTYGSGCMPRELPPITHEERLRMEKDRIKRIKAQQKHEDDRWKKWTLTNGLSDDLKERILKITMATFKQEKTERGWKSMANGIKWLLILIGITILLNGWEIVHLIELAINK